MRRFIPYLYLVFGLAILIGSFIDFFRDKEIYNIIFNWTTENKYLFILVKSAIAVLFLVTGYQKLKQLKE